MRYIVFSLISISLLVLGYLPIHSQSDSKGSSGDTVVFSKGGSIAGKLVSISKDGFVEMVDKDGSRVTTLLDGISRITLGDNIVSSSQKNASKIRLTSGGIMYGIIKSFNKDRFEIAIDGDWVISTAKHNIKYVILSQSADISKLKDEKKDVIITADGIEYGTLKKLDATAAIIEINGEAKEIKKDSLLAISIYSEKVNVRVTGGWFAKIKLKDGNWFVGDIDTFNGKELHLYSSIFGRVKLSKDRVNYIVLVTHPTLSLGNIIICESNRVRELDIDKKEIWSFSNNISTPLSATKLESGNVLICNSGYSQVIEVNQKGEIVWQYNSNYPYDAVRLENGNTLVSEYYGNRVVEIDSKGAVAKTIYNINYPTSVQRLENGNTLICSHNSKLIEVDKDGKVVWEPKLANIRPSRAVRLENGNTLITDMSNRNIVEMDRDSKTIWQYRSANPYDAIRLDNGNTLIADYSSNKVIEIDSSGNVVGEIKDVSRPMRVTMY